MFTSLLDLVPSPSPHLFYMAVDTSADLHPTSPVLLARSAAPPAPAGGQPSSSSPDPVLQAISDILAWLTSGMVSIETHIRPAGELAGGECFATSFHTCRSEALAAVAPVLSQDAE